MQYFTLINPLRYAIDIAHRVYLEGAGLDRLLPDLWPLAVIAAVTLSRGGVDVPPPARVRSAMRAHRSASPGLVALLAALAGGLHRRARISRPPDARRARRLERERRRPRRASPARSPRSPARRRGLVDQLRRSGADLADRRAPRRPISTPSRRCCASPRRAPSATSPRADEWPTPRRPTRRRAGQPPQRVDADRRPVQQGRPVSRASSGVSIPNPYDQYQLGFDASWEIDLFGRVRRSVEAAKADTEASVEDSRAVLISMLGDVGRAYIDLRGAQAKRRIVEDDIATERELLDLAGQRRRAGLSNDIDVARAAAEVSSAEAQLPLLDHQITQDINQLSKLLALRARRAARRAGRGRSRSRRSRRACPSGCPPTWRGAAPTSARPRRGCTPRRRGSASPWPISIPS